MRKGFIGPIGDDLPSIIALMLALGLFFSAVIYTLNVYNQKIADMDMLKGSIEIGRAVMNKGVLTKDDLDSNPNADYVAKSYALSYDSYLESDKNNCQLEALRFSYLVAVNDAGKIGLHTMMLCTWKG
jgi:hypothetical protein